MRIILSNCERRLSHSTHSFGRDRDGVGPFGEYIFVSTSIGVYTHFGKWTVLLGALHARAAEWSEPNYNNNNPTTWDANKT